MPKKEIILTVRVDEKMDRAIENLATKDDRTTAWMVRKLIEEALIARGIFDKDKETNR